MCLSRLDSALLSLRRLTSAPPPATGLHHGHQEVEVSTMLVVDTLAHHSDSTQRSSAPSPPGWSPAPPRRWTHDEWPSP